MSQLILILFLLVGTAVHLKADADGIPPEETVTIHTKLGKVRGLVSKSRNGNTFLSFIGIQYGEIETRFQVAKPYNGNGVIDATKHGDACPQMNIRTGQVSTEENCLYLNVYVPKGGERRKAVVVYIHGGAWIHGSSASIGPKFFMDEDVILVTMNYRLGPFGFLAMRNPRAPGNVGLKDQLLALRWVHDHIADFSGDNSKVTIMGESAGAGSVAHMIASPQATGLFRSAIHHSGSMLNEWTWRPISEAEPPAFELGEKLGCDVTNSDTLLDCLSKADVHDILTAHAGLAKFFIDPMIHFMPVMELDANTAFQSQNPIELMRNGEINRVPSIFTVCEKEGLLLHAATIIKSEKHIKELNENWVRNAGIQAFLDEDARLPRLSLKDKEEIMLDVRKYYFGSEKLIANDDWTMERLSELYTDRHFIHGVRETASIMSEYVPVYLGIFTRPGNDSVTRIFGHDKVFGVAHVDDLQFFFDEFGFGPFSLTPELTEYSKMLVKMWTNFAQNGVPVVHVDGDSEFKWDRVSSKERSEKMLKWLDLGNIPNVIENLFQERLSVWDRLYTKFEQKSTKDEL